MSGLFSGLFRIMFSVVLTFRSSDWVTVLGYWSEIGRCGRPSAPPVNPRVILIILVTPFLKLILRVKIKSESRRTLFRASPRTFQTTRGRWRRRLASPLTKACRRPRTPGKLFLLTPPVVIIFPSLLIQSSLRRSFQRLRLRLQGVLPQTVPFRRLRRRATRLPKNLRRLTVVFIQSLCFKFRFVVKFRLKTRRPRRLMLLLSFRLIALLTRSRRRKTPITVVPRLVVILSVLVMTHSGVIVGTVLLTNFVSLLRVNICRRVPLNGVPSVS